MSSFWKSSCAEGRAALDIAWTANHTIARYLEGVWLAEAARQGDTDADRIARGLAPHESWGRRFFAQTVFLSWGTACSTKAGAVLLFFGGCPAWPLKVVSRRLAAGMAVWLAVWLVAALSLSFDLFHAFGRCHTLSCY